MLEASLAAAAGTTTHRFRTSKPHWAHGHGERSLGRSAGPWRVAEARNHRLRRHRVRYLPDRRTRRSQTWRTFFANHVGNLAFASPVTSSFATGDDVLEACRSRIRRQADTGSWTKSWQWETQRTLFSSARATGCPPAKANGVWPSNDAWLRTAL